MAQSLRDRLLGRTSQPETPAGDGSASGEQANSHPQVGRLTPPSHNGATHPTPTHVAVPEPAKQVPRRSDASVISAVEKLKLELHKKLIDRLDLAALERITDETVLTAQIR